MAKLDGRQSDCDVVEKLAENGWGATTASYDFFNISILKANTLGVSSDAKSDRSPSRRQYEWCQNGHHCKQQINLVQLGFEPWSPEWKPNALTTALTRHPSGEWNKN